MIGHFEDSSEDSDEKPISLSERLKRIQLNTIKATSASEEHTEPCSPLEHSPHEQLIVDMMRLADRYGRDLLTDVCRLITVYYLKRSDDIDRIIREWTGSDRCRQELTSLRDVYKIGNGIRRQDRVPTLCRIAEAFPPVALVLASELYCCPQPKLRLWVSDEDLGADVAYHFQLEYFPGMINIDNHGLPAQIALFLHNLCRCQAIMTSSQKAKTAANTAWAFTAACKLSTELMEQRLTSVESRNRFTLFIKSLPITPALMNCVYKNVIGDVKLIPTLTVAVTRFHVKVLKSQPLDIFKWHQLLEA